MQSCPALRGPLQDFSEFCVHPEVPSPRHFRKPRSLPSRLTALGPRLMAAGGELISADFACVSIAFCNRVVALMAFVVAGFNSLISVISIKR